MDLELSYIYEHEIWPNLLKQVKLWFYKLAAAGLAADRKIKNYKRLEKIRKVNLIIKPRQIFKIGQNFLKTQPFSSTVKKEKYQKP